MPMARGTITQVMMLEVKILAGGGKVQGARFLTLTDASLHHNIILQSMICVISSILHYSMSGRATWGKSSFRPS